MIKIALTYDYELFFNDAFFHDKTVLIDATDGIMDALMSNDVRGTFFIETVMLQKFREIRESGKKISSALADALKTEDMVIDQIHRMDKNGFETGLHIHSIWNTAEWKDDVPGAEGANGKWLFNDMDYMPSAHSREVTAENIKYGISLLNCIADQEHVPHVVSFRAGGFSYEPPRLLYKLLYKYGVRLDSSVAKYIYTYAKNQRYNYKDVPTKLSHWNFSDGNVWAHKNWNQKLDEQVASSHMTEIPISATRDIPYKWRLYRKYQSVHCTPKGKPSTLIYRNIVIQKWQMFEKKFDRGTMLSMDSMHYMSMVDLIKHYQKELDEDGDTYIVAIGHPKFQDEKTINNMVKFIQECKKELACRFMTIREMGEELKEIQ